MRKIHHDHTREAKIYIQSFKECALFIMCLCQFIDKY